MAGGDRGGMAEGQGSNPRTAWACQKRRMSSSCLQGEASNSIYAWESCDTLGKAMHRAQPATATVSITDYSNICLPTATDFISLPMLITGRGLFDRLNITPLPSTNPPSPYRELPAGDACQQAMHATTHVSGYEPCTASLPHAANPLTSAVSASAGKCGTREAVPCTAQAQKHC